MNSKHNLNWQLFLRFPHWLPLFLLNRFSSVRISGIHISRRRAKLLFAHLILKRHKNAAYVKEDRVIMRIGDYELISSAYDESFLMSFEELVLGDEYEIPGWSYKGKIVLDVGANIGDTALYFASKGVKHVFALEPFSEPYKMLLNNIKRNQLASIITPIKKGVGFKDAILDVPFRANASGGNSITLRQENSSKSTYNNIETVETLSAKNLFEVTGRVDLIKMDCEGCEYELLGCDDLLTKLSPEKIYIEYHKGSDKIQSWLMDNSYVINNILVKNEYVGIILASRRA